MVAETMPATSDAVPLLGECFPFANLYSSIIIVDDIFIFAINSIKTFLF